jgi:hypothetical protein
MPTVTIVQPDGAGSAGAPDKALTGAWLDQPVELRGEDEPTATFQHTLLYTPEGSAAALSTPTAATSTFTPDVLGTYRFETRKSLPGLPASIVRRVVRVTKDAAGGNERLVSAALNEIPEEADYGGNTRGSAALWDFNIASLQDQIAAAGEVPAVRMITAGAGLDGGGDLSADRTLEIEPSVLASIAAAMPLPTGTVRIAHEAGDTTGASFRARVVAALILSSSIFVEPGAHRTDEPISIPSQARIFSIGEQFTTLEPGSDWAPASGSADDRTVTLLRVEGTVTAVSTTLASIAQADQRQANLTSATGTNELWLVFKGTESNHSGGDVYNASGAEAVESLAEVSGAPVGAWVNLRTPMRAHHRLTGTTVQSVSVVQGVHIEGIGFRTTGNHACAITSRYARNCRFDNLSFSGFARAGVDWIGVHSMYVGRVHDDGGNNSIVKGESIQHCVIGDGRWSFNPDGARCHANGIPRAKVDLSNQPIGNTIDVGQVGRGVCGVRIAGGWGHTTRGYEAIDFDSAPAKLRDPQTAGSQVATGYESGANRIAPPEAAEFGHGNHLESIVCINHRHDDTGSMPSDGGVCVYLHDDFGASVGTIQIVNKGPGPTETINGDSNFGCYGVSIKDWSGSIDAINATGASYALQTYGTFARAAIGSVNLVGNAGRSLAQIPVYFNHGIEGAGPDIALLTINGFNERIRFGPNFADPSLRIREYRDGSQVWTEVSAAFASSAVTRGKIGTISSSGTTATTKRRVAHATGPGTNACVIVAGGPLDASTGWCLVAKLPGAINYVETAGAVNAGDKLESNASGVAVVNAAATWDACIGRAKFATAAGGMAAVEA